MMGKEFSGFQVELAASMGAGDLGKNLKNSTREKRLIFVLKTFG